MIIDKNTDYQLSLPENLKKKILYIEETPIGMILWQINDANTSYKVLKLNDIWNTVLKCSVHV